MYENTMTAHAKAAEISVLVKAKIKQHVPWENENIIEKREMVKKAYEVCLRVTWGNKQQSTIFYFFVLTLAQK